MYLEESSHSERNYFAKTPGRSVLLRSITEILGCRRTHLLTWRLFCKLATLTSENDNRYLQSAEYFCAKVFNVQRFFLHNNTPNKYSRQICTSGAGCCRCEIQWAHNATISRTYEGVLFPLCQRKAYVTISNNTPGSYKGEALVCFM